nr:ParB N-terminal domain-containing protein [Leptospira borgpetersenii]
MSKENPRKNFNSESLQELAESIKKYGLIQPISVRKIGNVSPNCR